MSLNSSCYVLKSIKKNLDVYKLIIQENSLMLHLRAFIIRKVLLFTKWYHKYTKKIKIVE